jgi:hypothetical protein
MAKKQYENYNSGYVPYRKKDETLEKYQERRANQEMLIKVYLQLGNVLWDSKKQGTYIKAKHGPIGV